MLKGLYKVEMHTVHGSRRGVLYVYDGKMMGGNSAFAFIGTYQESDRGEVSVEISTLRHNEDPNFQPLFKSDKVTLALKGRQQGEQYFFEGGATQLPGVVFNSVMTPISEEAAPPVVAAGKGGTMARFAVATPSSIMSAPTPARTAGGRANSSTTNTRRARASGRCSAAMRSASAFPAATPMKARLRKRLRWPASAAFVLAPS